MGCVKPLKGWLNKKGKGVVFRMSEGYADYPMQVPCGQCIECRLEKSRQWAVRIIQEAQMHEDNCFVTLTYDDENLPKNKTLVKRDLQLFFKRLRKLVEPKKIRYYACGEYGDETNRPHYHIIIFNYYPSDYKHYKTTDFGRLYTSKELENAWSKDQKKIGHVVFGSVTFETASYTARYTTKKITGEKAKEHYQNRIPEFSLMSRRPGIGMTWLEKYGDETWRDGNIVARGRAMRPPLAYRRKLQQENPELYKLDQKKVKNPFLSDPDYHYLYGLLNPRRLLAREKISNAKLGLTGKNQI